MTDHMWVMMTYVPIEVEVDPDNDEILHTYTREGADEIAREEGLLGCWHCLEPLNAITYYTECSGKSNLTGNLDL